MICKFEYLESQHPIINIFDSRFLKIHFLVLFYSRAHILRTLFNIRDEEDSYLDGCITENVSLKVLNFLVLTCGFLLYSSVLLKFQHLHCLFLFWV